MEIYDCVDSIRYLSDSGSVVASSAATKIEIVYVLGATERDGARITGGIKYIETYPFGFKAYPVKVDGNIIDRYPFIDFDSLSVTIYNQDYNLSRNGNVATLKSLVPYEVWLESDDEGTLSMMGSGFKEEFLDRVSEEPHIAGRERFGGEDAQTGVP